MFPKWGNFAKSGHTEFSSHLYHLSLSFFLTLPSFSSMCPVWPYLFDIWPFTLCLIRTTICPTYADKFAKYYLVNHKNGQRFWNIYQRGKISPNLVTVSLTHSLTHSHTQMFLTIITDTWHTHSLSLPLWPLI